MTVLIETKQNFTVADEEQLSAYVEYEKALTGNKTVAILANTINDNIKVWRGVVSDSDLMPKETLNFENEQEKSRPNSNEFKRLLSGGALVT